MTPEARIAELEKEVRMLRDFVMSFSNVSQLTPETQRSIGASLTAVSSKTAASATQAVNEAGGNTYSVMVPPSGFISIGGLNVPYII